MKKLDKKNIRDILSLTPMQQGMLFHYLKEPESDLYFNQLCLEISGEPDIGGFTAAWNFVVKTNEMLRTFFRWENVKNPLQIILKDHTIQLQYIDFSGKPGSEKMNHLEEIKKRDRQEGFDLREVPFRIILCKLKDARYYMVISNHHILYDGWSNGIILKEFFEASSQLNKVKSITELKLPRKKKFKEFILWLQQQDKSKEREEVFWKQYLGNFAGEAQLPLKRKKSLDMKEKDRSGTIRYQSCLGPGTSGSMERFAAAFNITPAVLFYTAWGVLLQRYSNSEDVLFGTTVSGRSAKIPGIENMVGLFINTIPLRVKSHANETVLELLDAINKTMQLREEYENTSLMDISRYSQIKWANEQELFDSIVALENYPLDNRLVKGNNTLSIHSYSLFEHPHYDLTIVINTFDSTELRFIYNKKLLDKSTIEKISRELVHLLREIVDNPHKRIEDIELLLEEEKQKILHEFNNTSAEYPKDKTIHELFEEQVKKTPDNIAVIGTTPGENDRLITSVSYRALNRKSNQLSRILRKKGVTPDTTVSIMVDRSLEMIYGILGILKASGAYLPIETDYPAERVKYLLEDSDTNILLTSRTLELETNIKTKPIDIGYLEAMLPDDDNTGITNLENINHAENLAYVLYTSGTTGRPKGAMVEHKHVVRLMRTNPYPFDFSENDVWTMFHSYCFDLSVWEMNGALLYGGRLIVTPKLTARDPEKFLRLLKKQAVTILTQTPAAFYNLAAKELFYPENQLKLEYVILAGEALYPAKLRKLKEKYPAVTLVNMYGITETTVYSTYKKIGDNEIVSNISNIGIPMPTSSIYIMNKHLKLAPTEVAGELCVGGEGVGRGYLNQVELTKEKFVDNPYKPGEILYKSGDLARFLDNGDVEYLERIDLQVKIRGFRIELGEVENQLLSYRRIKEAVVLARENQNGEKYLCAYIVPHSPGSSNSPPPTDPLNLSDLRAHLSKGLPDYMVPTYFVTLKTLPLTPNGKIDRRVLPSPQGLDLNSGVEYSAPRTITEKKLVEIWQEVLGKEVIGVNDNFLEVGGESIKAIQITSKMSRAGYKVTVADIFKYPVISQLALAVKKLKRVPDQSVAAGNVPLTPIQKVFFQENKTNPNHFNQAFMLCSHDQKGFEEKAIKRVFNKIQQNHDALRMTYKKEKERIIQINHSLDYPLSLQTHDYRNMNREQAVTVVENKVNEIQAGIDIETGPLMKLGLFRLDEGDRLLIAIHHLVVDGVSWRILFEDIETLYSQYKKRNPLQLPLKTDSFQVWSEKLSEYGSSEKILKEKNYWRELESKPISKIKKDFEVTNNLVKDTETLSFHLTEADTEKLLTKVNQAFNTKIDDILLTALGLAFNECFWTEKLALALESHGRMDISGDIDISRTVGWFTALYPVILDLSYKNNLSRQIIEVKETLHRVPGNGTGYGILEYLTPETFKKELKFNIEPQVIFNYLGQFDADFKGMSLEITKESVGNTEGGNIQRKFELEISGIIMNNRLEMTIRYNKKQYKKGTLRKLWNRYQGKLHSIISYCSLKKERVLTPVDLTYKEISIDTLARLCSQYSLEDIYPLAPMQEGLLFHALYYPTSATYFMQVSYRFYGEIHLRSVKKSFEELLTRYDVLRTVFLHENLGHPLQVVLKNREVKVHHEDIRQIEREEEKEAFIRAFKEKNRQHLFDLTHDVLIRLAVIRMEEAEYEFIWSWPHIVMDGWSNAILISEFFEIYYSCLEKRNPRLPKVKPYRTYIEWLGNQDKNESKRYWKKYLKEYNTPVSIPSKKVIDNFKTGYSPEEVSYLFEREKTNRLKEFSGKNQVTLNIILQTVWAIILGKYNDTRDVVFGTVVSGRPAEIEEVESMVGLFINTIPVRIQYEGQERLIDLMHRFQDEALRSEPHHFLPLTEIQSQSTLRQNLLDHIFAFENYPLTGSKENLPIKINEEFSQQSSYHFNIVIEPGEQLEIKLAYNAHTFETDFVEKTASHIGSIVQQIIENPDIKIQDIQISYDFVEVNTNMIKKEEGDFQF